MANLRRAKQDTSVLQVKRQVNHHSLTRAQGHDARARVHALLGRHVDSSVGLGSFIFRGLVSSNNIILNSTDDQLNVGYKYKPHNLPRVNIPTTIKFAIAAIAEQQQYLARQTSTPSTISTIQARR